MLSLAVNGQVVLDPEGQVTDWTLEGLVASVDPVVVAKLLGILIGFSALDATVTSGF